MTGKEIDLTGRLTAMQELLSFLMAHHLAGLPEADARAVSASFLGGTRQLGIGMMDAADLQEIGQAADNTLAMILVEAAGMADEWRSLRGV